MDKLIGKISEIEASASSIMDSVNHRKAALSDEISRRTAAFDAQLEADTEAKLTALRASLEEDLNSRLAKTGSRRQGGCPTVKCSDEIPSCPICQTAF